MVVKDLKDLCSKMNDDDFVLIAIDVEVPMDVVQASILTNKEHDRKGLLLSSYSHETFGTQPANRQQGE